MSSKTNLCPTIRGTQGKGLMPDGTSRFTLKVLTNTDYNYNYKLLLLLPSSTISSFDISCHSFPLTHELKQVSLLA